MREEFTELVFKEKAGGIYYAEDLNVPAAAGNKITDSLIKRKYFLYQRGLNEK